MSDGMKVTLYDDAGVRYEKDGTRYTLSVTKQRPVNAADVRAVDIGAIKRTAALALLQDIDPCPPSERYPMTPEALAKVAAIQTVCEIVGHRDSIALVMKLLQVSRATANYWVQTTRTKSSERESS